MKTALSAGILILGMIAAVQVYGHRPIESEQPPDHHEHALTIDRPEVSQVYYGALNVDRPQVWFRFHGRKDQQIYFSVGVPAIERLKGYRPEIALIGPGFGGSAFDTALPFDVPDGQGVQIYTGEGKPRFFHEHFTGTDSWIHIEITRTLPANGDYYLVAYTPDNPKPGDKLWLTMGTKERFKFRDLFTFRRWKRDIRRFHEIP